MQAVVFSGSGGNDVVTVEDVADPVPAAREVVVAASFAGVNPADVLQREGRYPAPRDAPQHVPGLEAAGVVVAVGDKVAKWKTGDRVMGIVGGGGLASRVVLDEDCAVAVPPGLSDLEAAAVPEAFVTAHDALRTQACLGPGEVLLVHGGAGGVGSAAIQIGAAAGARVFAAVRSTKAARFVESLGAVAVDDATFVDDVRDHAGGGVDVVLELVGAPHFPGNLDVLARKGRIVVIGVGAGADVSASLLKVMAKHATIRGSVLRGRPLYEKAQAVRAFEREVLPLLEAGSVRPVVDAVFDADDVAAAFDRVSASGKRGRVLIAFPQDPEPGR